MAIELGLIRILQVFVFQLFIGLFFLYLSYRILKKNRSRLNITFSLFYIFPAVGLLLNVVYSLIDIESVVVTLNFLTNFCISFGVIFLYCTNKILLESQMVFSKKDQLKVVLIYAGLFALMAILYPFGQGVTINEGTEWKPVWELPLLIYVFILLSIALILILSTSIKIIKQFKDDTLRKKWRFFIIGVVGLFIYMFGAYLSNYVNQPAFRTGFSLFGLTVILWIYLIYYGIGRQIE
ncbi:MAG: hypothetical protein R6U96_02295 [Promethearchaeia archaeon]